LIPNPAQTPLGMLKSQTASRVSMPVNPNPCQHPRFVPVCVRLLRGNQEKIAKSEINRSLDLHGRFSIFPRRKKQQPLDGMLAHMLSE
jgi:hypothetical protein